MWFEGDERRFALPKVKSEERKNVRDIFGNQTVTFLSQMGAFYGEFYTLQPKFFEFLTLGIYFDSL